jgi:hypothetical protein
VAQKQPLSVRLEARPPRPPKQATKEQDPPKKTAGHLRRPFPLAGPASANRPKSVAGGCRNSTGVVVGRPLRLRGRFAFVAGNDVVLISDMRPQPRGAIRPSCARNVRPEMRAWGMPGARRTRSRAWCVVNTRVSHHGYTGSPGIPARNGFTVSFGLSSVIGLFCHRRLRGSLREA